MKSRTAGRLVAGLLVLGTAWAAPALAGTPTSTADVSDPSIDAATASPAEEDRLLRQRAQRRRNRDLGPGSEQADTQRPPPGLAGGWFGIKDKLEDIGIVPTARYGTELAWNMRGGDRHEIAETGQLDVGLLVELKRLTGLIDGTLQATVTYRRGKDLGALADLGVLQQVQEVYGRGQTWRLTQFWYEQTIGGDLIDVKLGRTAPGEDFAAFSCTFQNLAFCGSQPGNIVGDYWYNWPIAQWGARARVNVGRAYVQAAVYEVNPRNLSKDFLGWHLHGQTGALVPVEVGFVRGGRSGGPVGSLKIGGWVNTSNARDLLYDDAGQPVLLADQQRVQHSSRRGVYVNVQQQLTGRSKDGKAVSGVTVFLNATQADKATSRVDSQVSGGFFYRGLIPWFSEDVFGVAFARTHVNTRVARLEGLSGQARQRSEYEAELYYGFHPYFWLELRPNLQWIHDPGGYHARRDIAVAGLKGAFTL